MNVETGELIYQNTLTHEQMKQMGFMQVPLSLQPEAKKLLGEKESVIIEPEEEAKTPLAKWAKKRREKFIAKQLANNKSKQL
jgi:hypothetical protein